MINWTPEKRKVADLKLWDRNPRTITKEDFEKLKDRITKRGMHDVLKINTDGTILSGNQRKRALTDLGIEEVFVMVPDHTLTDEEAQIVAGESNRSDGKDDFDILVQDYNLETLKEIGYSDLEIQKIGLDLSKEDDFDPDEEIAAAGENPVAQRGDIYKLGQHVLMCGDCTKCEEVEKLMGGGVAKMLFTDPPWNVAIGKDSNPKHRQREGLVNDDLGADFPAFLSSFAEVVPKFVDGDIYCVMGCEEWPAIHKALTEVGLHWSATIVWVKDVFVLGRSKYHRRYEPIWYGWKEKSSYTGQRDQNDVWEIPRPKKSEEHPTMKPIELVVKALVNSSVNNDIVLDLFGGSGTTLIACEQVGRSCRMMEIDPKYVDVIIKRWEKISGQKAEKIN